MGVPRLIRRLAARGRRRASIAAGGGRAGIDGAAGQRLGRHGVGTTRRVARGCSLDDVVQTIKFGIRSDHDDARVGDMPAFLTDETLDKGQIEAVTEYVLKLSKQDFDAKLAAKGSAVYKENCADCHRAGGKGNVEFGAPNLTDAIWLYSSDRAEIVKSISFGRAGVMPNWNEKLSEATIKQIAIWLRAEAGGQ